MKATGPDEVTVELTVPNADLPVILGTFHFHIVKEGATDFNAGIGIPLFLASLDAHTAKVKGLSPIPLGGMMGYNFAKNVWLDT